jgi:hypothetical protein
MIGAFTPFVETRTPGQRITYFGENIESPAAPENFTPDSGNSHNPLVYSRFLGGRGRAVYPATQDVASFFNPATRNGGMGSSWDWERLGGLKTAMPASLIAVNRSRSINRPRTHGVLPWAVRTNTYRDPAQSYSEASDNALYDDSQPASDETSFPIF